jgi:tyrosyl-tRNA synthetase
MMNFIEELKWRGMIHDIMPGTEEQLKKELTTAYVGIDPTGDSLHIGHLVGVMMLKLFQIAGHKPIALIGGATGMIGDPSGRSAERNLLDENTLRKNQEGIKKQLSKFLDFNSSTPNSAELVNNYDWMKEFTFLEFIRDIGKHITVNYMTSKDSVKKRLGDDSKTGMSFTEFTYQLVQGFDFLYLYRNRNCKLQMGGSDQWGNITTGNELIRRKDKGEAYALTWPLIEKSDGSKFGKSEEGNIWLDPRYTSPYEFYQFWINTSDEDAEKYIKIFTMLKRDKINDLIEEHRKAPHLRILQKKLAGEVTVMVHSKEDYNAAVEASSILFGKGTAESLQNLDEDTFLSVFEGVPLYEVSAGLFKKGINLEELLVKKSPVFSSKGELKRMIDGGGLNVNKEKISDSGFIVSDKNLLNKKYLLIQKGKKNYYILRSL